MRRGRPAGHRRSSGYVRAAALALVSAVISVAAPGSASALAQAAGYAGYCTDDEGVTVVIDFNELGGGTVIRCAPAPLPGGGTGLDALKAAGIEYEGVARWGGAFICRISGKPAPDQDIAIDGNAGYREQCINTPPPAAYWSYWHASNGGSWTYSQWGVKNREAIPGGFEGWSFSLNATTTTNPPPDVAPLRPDPPPEPDPDPPDGGTGGSDEDDESGRDGGSDNDGSGGSGGSNESGGTNDPDGGSDRSSGESGGAGDGRTPRPDSTTTAPGSTSPTPVTPEPTAGDAASPSQPGSASTSAGEANSLTVAPSGDDGGTATGTLVGLGALAFLVTVGLGTIWLRRAPNGTRQ